MSQNLQAVADYEQKRLFALRQLNLLDTPPSESFDRITRMASQLFDLPIAAVSLSDEDRQWFKSRVGVEHWQIPRFQACCGEVSDSSELLVIPNLLESRQYRDSYLAQSGIRFYAGAPLLTREGYTLGAMCVLGNEPRSVTEQELSVLQDLADMVMAQIELQHAFGRIDPLTGLPNRSQFVENLQDQAREEVGTPRFALYIDLLDVPQIRSLQRVLGASCLDELSQRAAHHLQHHLGHDHALYQVDSCQYVYLATARNESDALNQAATMQQLLVSMPLEDTFPSMVRPVVGVAPFKLGEASPADVLRMSHSACQDARQAETKTSLYSLAVDVAHQRRFTLRNEFRLALESPEQLRLVYQPRITMASGDCQGVEALIRWHHPQLGEVSPAEFIPLVENTLLARPLTQWVIHQAVRQAAIWYRQGLGLRVSINISASNLEEEDFTERLLAALEQEGIPGTAIELELTESALIGNGRGARAQLDRLNRTGIRIAIDDFGTGYSSLAYLQEIPAQVVKIDRSFIARLDQEARSQTLVKAMISMAHDLDYHVVAEGAETQETHLTLQRLGCDEIQGYLYGKPVGCDAFEAWLAELRRSAE